MRCLNCGRDKLSLDTVTCPQCGVHIPSLMRDCLEPGTMLWHNTYHIDYPLGKGGFGITYRAFDTHLERSIAIKEFYPQEHAVREGKTGRLAVPHTKQDVYKRALERFLKEGKLLAKLDNPGVVRVYNSFQERETAYLAMELINGQTLRDEMNAQPDGTLSLERISQIMPELVNALDLVHQKGIYHLDIAPDNIMVTEEGRVILIDFGASRQGLGGKTTQAYKEAYAPPEVISGGQPGPESDIFELGMMLHEMLTGELPPSSISRLLSIARDKQDICDGASLEDPWREQVLWAIQVQQEERPKSVREWWKANGSYRYSAPAAPANPPNYNPNYNPNPNPNSPSQTNSNHSNPSFPPNPNPTAPPNTGLQPAGLWLRLMAYLIDVTFLLITSAIIHLVLGIYAFSADEYFGQLMGIYIVIALVYCPVLESSKKQGTLGKMLMGIKVTDTSGTRIKLGQAYVRHVCKIFSYLTFLFGFLMAGFTKHRQALHDLIAKCLVIKRT